MAVEPPKIAEAKCSHRRTLRPEDSKPPRQRYSLRLANIAAAEKQPNASAVPTKAVTKILEETKNFMRQHVLFQHHLRSKSREMKFQSTYQEANKTKTKKLLMKTFYCLQSTKTIPQFIHYIVGPQSLSHERFYNLKFKVLLVTME